MAQNFKPTDLTQKVTDLLNNCSNLSKDYKNKHDELLEVFEGFKLTIAWITQKQNQQVEGCQDLINMLIKLIEDKTPFKNDEKEILSKLKKKQNEIMAEFTNTDTGVVSVVQGLEDLLKRSKTSQEQRLKTLYTNSSAPASANATQAGGGSKKNKSKKNKSKKNKSKKH